MAKAGRRILKLILFLVLLVVVAAFGLNLMRLHHDAPAAAASVMQVHNAFVDFYGAKNGTRVLLFDVGTDPLGRSLDALLAEMKASRDDVTDLFLTHGHGDHLGAASLLPRAKVHVGQGDVGLVDHSDMPILQRVMSLLQPVGAVKPGDVLAGPVDVNVGGGQSVKAIPMPGHTPGSYAYFWDGVLFVGDSLQYKEGRLEPAVAAFTDDVDGNKRAIAALPAQLRGLAIESICTGHGGCTPRGQTKKLLDDVVKRVQ